MKHEVIVTHKRLGKSTVDMEKPELDRLIQDWRAYKSEETEYHGTCTYELANGEIVESNVTSYRVPRQIKSITVDGVVVPERG